MRELPHIRIAEAGDIPALAALAARTYAAAFGHTMSASDLEAHLAKHLSPAAFARILADDVMLVAELAGELIGYAQFGAAHPESGYGKGAELRRLYVDTAYQHAGIGTELLGAALKHPLLAQATAIYLDVWEHNAGAQRLYRRFGFEVVGTRAFEVESGAETSLDLIMVRRA